MVPQGGHPFCGGRLVAAVPKKILSSNDSFARIIDITLILIWMTVVFLVVNVVSHGQSTSQEGRVLCSRMTPFEFPAFGAGKMRFS